MFYSLDHMLSKYDQLHLQIDQEDKQKHIQSFLKKDNKARCCSLCRLYKYPMNLQNIYYKSYGSLSINLSQNFQIDPQGMLQGKNHQPN